MVPPGIDEGARKLEPWLLKPGICDAVGGSPNGQCGLPAATNLVLKQGSGGDFALRSVSPNRRAVDGKWMQPALRRCFAGPGRCWPGETGDLLGTPSSAVAVGDRSARAMLRTRR
jgi:hypothetical protein